MEKQDAFTQALLRAMDAAEQEAGVRQPRLRRAVEQYGGIHIYLILSNIFLLNKSLRL